MVPPAPAATISSAPVVTSIRVTFPVLKIDPPNASRFALAAVSRALPENWRSPAPAKSVRLSSVVETPACTVLINIGPAPVATKISRPAPIARKSSTWLHCIVPATSRLMSPVATRCHWSLPSVAT